PFNLTAVGRMADGATLDGVSRELAGLSRRTFREWATSYQDSAARYVSVPLRTVMLGPAGDTLAVFVAAVALVLLIVVANVASLTLVRALARGREMSLRMTLGATRARLAQLLMTESVVLALAGAVLGVVLGVGGLHVLTIVGAEIPRLDAARLGPRAVAFALAVGIVSGAAAGLYPALLLLKGGASRPLGDGPRTAGEGRGMLAVRGGFVVGQFALALPLLAAAGLLLNSFLRLQSTRPGFDPARVLTVRVSIPSARYATDTAVYQFWTRVLAHVHEIPGVEAVGLNTAVPPADPNVCCNNFDLVDHPVAPGAAQPTSPWMMASADYFAALGLRIEEGRPFARSDTGAAPVVAVSRAWARHYFPEGNILGRRLISGGCITCPLTTIVAVVSDVKYAGLDGSADAVYEPITEGWSSGRSIALFVRTRGAPRDAIPAVRTALWSVDPGLPLDDATTMEEQLAQSLTPSR
ncbi:MAG: FtsX-like permease family protein, partial [Solirubrobacteraceae bacterium]